MAEFSGRSPKRRRTDTATLSVSPEQLQITQTNATLNYLTGQRQNRWMHGYIDAPPAGKKDGGDTNARATSRTEERQTGNGLGSGEATSTRLKSPRLRFSNSINPNGSMARESRQASGNMARADAGSPVGPAARAEIVNYESPYTSISNGRNSIERMPSTNNVPGLPSPAPSDEYTNSPTTRSSNDLSFMASVADTAPLPRKRGRPPKQPPAIAILPSTHSPMVSAASHQHPAAAPSVRFGSTGRTASFGNRSAFQPPVPTHQRLPSNSGHVSPSLVQTPTQSVFTASATPQGHNTADPFAPSVLRGRISAFEQCRAPLQKLGSVDHGRLALLRDSVASQQIDWFYLALSQVHALTEQNKQLPQVIHSLPKTCWKYVDDLLCSNKLVSPTLLHWLADFPLPIEQMYSGGHSSSYSVYVTAVANFLNDLPTKWDNLVAHCRSVQAPPLTQDLALGLSLGSSVLQTVAFRAITRMIYNGPCDGEVLEHLEVLHRWDQQAYNQRQVFRQPEQKQRAYSAFQKVRGSWVNHVQMREAHDKNQQHLPPMSKTRLQPYSVASSCPNVPAVFDIRLTPGFSSNFVLQHIEQQSRTPLQQQQAMIANDQRLRVALAPAPAQTQARTLTQSPAQQIMPQQRSSSNAPTTPVLQMPRQSQQPNSRLLIFPHENDGPRAQPTEPSATRSALHQAHLRSPVPVPLHTGTEMPRLYRYVSNYALSPTRLNGIKPISFLTFDLSQAEFDCIPKTQASQNEGELPNRILTEESQTYRLRCCAMPPKGFATASEWVTSDTHWPDALYLELNGNILEPRRPLHHKKYLPIDLTKYLKVGTNEIRALINRTSNDKRAFDYALAVEIVGVVSHSTLVNKLDTAQSIPATTTKASIQKALSGAGGGDDDIAITSTSMTIKLFDPFSGSKIFTTPVRGANCVHKDCFDLEIFLSQCKRDKPGYPTAVDCWRCPLCRGDVRPSMLVRDEWLVEVRGALERQGRLETRAIVVEADGSWRPKAEEKTGVRSASLEREDRGAAKKIKSNGGTPVPVKKVIEIIELD